MLGSAFEIDKDSSAASNLAIASRWLQECLSNHQGEHASCESLGPVALPTRLIDVGASATTLREPFLVETKGETGTYAALSYCWGDPSEHPPLKTTRQNIEEHKIAMPLASMPKTLQDAIFLAVYLGLQYIWIDAICIIQDDPDDWASETEHLDQIFSNATVTFAADHGEGSSSGLFVVDQKIGEPPQELQLDGRTVCVRNNGERNHFHGPSTAPTTNDEPLNHRAWTMQESMQSNRILRYPGLEMIWSCRSFDVCACRRNKPRLHAGKTETYQRNETESDADYENRMLWLKHSIREQWHQVIRIFSSRDIRYQSDYLPAFGGVAKTFFSLVRTRLGYEDRYIAGMWESALPLGLLWQSSEFKKRRRPREWRAPSWSWASVEALVDHPHEKPSFSMLRFWRLKYILFGRNARTDRSVRVRTSSFEAQSFTASV